MGALWDQCLGWAIHHSFHRAVWMCWRMLSVADQEWVVHGTGSLDQP